MKILIEESVLRQALDALIDFNQQSIGGVALPAEIDTAMDALRTALDAAEKVEPDYELVIDYGGLVLLRGELKHPHGTKLYTHPAPAVPEDK